MKIGICSASHLEVKLDKSLEYIGIDKGIESLLNQDIVPIIGIGDFDSINNLESLNNLKIKQLPVSKDITDTQFGVEYAINNGYDEIDLYGVTGGRLDHFMAVMCLLEKYQNINIKIIDQQNTISLLKPGSHIIPLSNKYKYFSIFALTDSYITLVGCLYPLDNYLLTREDPLCVSNQVDGKETMITNSENIILIESKDIM